MAESGKALADGWAGVVKGRPKVGDAAERSRRTSVADVVAFTEMTGDRNPLHFDRELAERSVFGKFIVEGGVTTGILNAVVAEDLPGPGTVFLDVNWKFLKAVGIDEEITGRVEVLSVRPDKPICELSSTVYNASGEVVVSGTATTYTVPLPSPPGGLSRKPVRRPLCAGALRAVGSKTPAPWTSNVVAALSLPRNRHPSGALLWL